MELEAEVFSIPSANSVEENHLVKTQLNSFNDDIATSALIGCICKHIDEYEKSTILNLEKSNSKSRHICTLNINGQRITDPQEILDIQINISQKFYTQLSEDNTI